jgi:hypothetical protein
MGILVILGGLARLWEFSSPLIVLRKITSFYQCWKTLLRARVNAGAEIEISCGRGGQNRNFLRAGGAPLTRCHARNSFLVPRGNEDQSFHWIHDLRK